MKGTAHLAIGAGAGYIVANIVQTEPAATGLLIAIGAVAGLMPDIDIDGKLSNKITFSHKIIRSIAQVIGFLMMIYSFFLGAETEKWLGIGVGIGIIAISMYITQRRMLTVTGIGVLAGGISLDESWLILLAGFIIIASFVPHRSYTHSILGVIFFGVISSQFQEALGIEGVFAACMAGYISHLAADMRFLPFNKRGIKLFLPLSSKEL
ncbi:metal-dependent hydrolase [Peribacillus saganii]|uniref:Metal-dependent hydrolase n=1 Tax=Peribacillus saganii TaxID=2303992 RepID=A0A372LPF2_9BACI|nr:metal-dependent hydrolase [Peribacillus saganii]RFU69454.1 metal-dependent hydrolase [Peribacillus saganii]